MEMEDLANKAKRQAPTDSEAIPKYNTLADGVNRLLSQRGKILRAPKFNADGILEDRPETPTLGPLPTDISVSQRTLKKSQSSTKLKAAPSFNPIPLPTKATASKSANTNQLKRVSRSFPDLNKARQLQQSSPADYIFKPLSEIPVKDDMKSTLSRLMKEDLSNPETARKLTNQMNLLALKARSSDSPQAKQNYNIFADKVNTALSKSQTEVRALKFDASGNLGQN